MTMRDFLEEKHIFLRVQQTIKYFMHKNLFTLVLLNSRLSKYLSFEP